MNEDFEKILCNAFLRDEKVLISMLSYFQEKHFDDENIGKIYKRTAEYYEKWHHLPDEAIVDSWLGEDAKHVLHDVLSMHLDLAKSSDWIEDKADEFIKTKALRHAIVDSVALVDQGKFAEVEEKVKDALASGTKIDLGLAYFKDMKERVMRMFRYKDLRFPTGMAHLDRATNGGFIVPSLNVVLGKINLGKSLFLSNLALSMSAMGYNIALITLEIVQDLIAQRLDAHMTGFDINQIYRDKRLMKELLEEGKARYQNNCGEIWIKEFPPKSITIQNIKGYLRELDIRKYKYDIVMVDYLTLLNSWKSVASDNLYSTGKNIAEELRALSYYTGKPIFTVSQLNRPGTQADFEELDMHHTGESMGIIATADFAAIIGRDEQEMVYENEISWKVIKNRMGQKGLIWKTYLNPNSLTLYDSVEDFARSFETSDGEPTFAGEQEDRLLGYSAREIYAKHQIARQKFDGKNWNMPKNWSAWMKKRSKKERKGWEAMASFFTSNEHIDPDRFIEIGFQAFKRKFSPVNFLDQKEDLVRLYKEKGE
jgi:replicative DNA helicase